MDNNCNRPISISVVILVAVSTMQLSSTILFNDSSFTSAYAKYSNSQTQSLLNDCGDSSSIGINCTNNGPQTQGKDNTVTTPIDTQISNPAPKQILQVRQVEGNPITIAEDKFGTATAECAPDEFVTGGGFDIDESGIELFPNFVTEKAFSGPPAGWSVTAFTSASDGLVFNAFAECAKLVVAP